LNSLMVVTQEASYLKDVEAWIRRLDIGATTPGRRIYVYDVQNGKADDLAESLSRILSISFEPSSSSEAGRQRSLDSRGGTNSPRSSLMNSGAATAEPRLESRAAPVGTQSSDDPGALKIVPNTENNALLIYATPNEFSVIESALRRLDVTPIQVLIEA